MQDSLSVHICTIIVKMHKIGVFDSGVGGESVVNAIKKSLENLEIVYKTDRENIPYGDKTPQQLMNLVIPILKSLEDEGCEVIVVACNTVTTTIIKEVREVINVPVVAVEPMIKPACSITKSKKIIVCATPATLNSPRYKELLELNSQDIEVFEPDCSKWAYLIENNQHNIDKLQADISVPLENGADVVVLACTHYHWIEDEIKIIADKYHAQVIQPEQAIINRLKTVLEQLD